MTINELAKLEKNSFIARTYGARTIKYHVAEYVGHTLTEPNRQILPIFKLLPMDPTEPSKYLWEFNADKYTILERKDKKCY